MSYYNIDKCLLSDELFQELHNELNKFKQVVDNYSITSAEVYSSVCSKFIESIKFLIYKCDLYQHKFLTSEVCKKQYKLNEIRRDMYIIDDINNLKPRVNSRMGYIYAIEWGDKIKIGKTKNPKRRLKELTTIADYGEIKIGDVAVSIQHTNYSETENLIHKHFNKFRIGKTEVFNITMDDVLNFADGLITYNDNVGDYECIGHVYFENDEFTKRNISNGLVIKSKRTYDKVLYK